MDNIKPIIAITMGDPVGIGPEIIMKSFASEEMYGLCQPVVIGAANWFLGLGSAPKIKPVQALSECQFKPGQLEVLDAHSDLLEPPTDTWQYGVPHPKAAHAALSAIRKAAALAMDNKVDAIVTAPINKEALKKVGFAHPGHTEFLAELSGVNRYGMMMVGGGLKIMLTTIHLALNQVPALIKKELLLEKIVLTDQALKTDFGLPQGRIAVASLNPHGGEGGMFGSEEINEIQPAVEAAQRQGINACGPFPSDTLFFKLKEGRFDAAVGLYHDQALIPIKLLAFGHAVNVTVGLPFIRTSVDHGTAFDIAGKGVADPGSLKEAISLAVEMVKHRKAVHNKRGQEDGIL